MVSVAGVAGFEPTNDGVRGMRNTSKMAQKHQKIPKNRPFLHFSPLNSPR